ncbi:MAG TPA: hypothetical protein VES66_00495 [Terriglobales bacterium]|nr:hypothetical protein [Terriglobales bacterium]
MVPSSLVSETIQVEYFMNGPFGGYGGFIRAEKNRRTYAIDASVGGQAAEGVKVIAYLPGCEIVMLNIPIRGTSVERQLPCRPLHAISLHGQIFPVSITQEQPTGVEVVYMAMWSHEFYGIMDGPVTAIRLATVVPDSDGQFEAKLPDFNRQLDLGAGEFEFILREHATGNIIAFLRPVEPRTNSRRLKVRSSYAPMQFMAERQ